jgi:hypothetical protein
VADVEKMQKNICARFYVFAHTIRFFQSFGVFPISACF